MLLKRCSIAFLAPVLLAGCCCHSPGSHEKRKGDEIVAAGQFFHTGTPVVLWMDPGGYDAYRVERRFVPYDEADFESSRPHLDAPHKPNRYDIRDKNLTPEELERKMTALKKYTLPMKKDGVKIPLWQDLIDIYCRKKGLNLAVETYDGEWADF